MGKLKIVICIILFSTLLSVKCFAEPQLIDEFLNSGENLNYHTISDKLDFDTVVGCISKTISAALNKNYKIFFVILSLIILITLLEAFTFSSKKELKTIFSVTVTIAIISICFDSIKNNVQIIEDTLETAKVFSTSAIPIVTTLSISSGEAFGSTVFSICVAACSSIFQFVSDSILIPVIILFLFISIADTFTTDFNLQSLSELIKKIFKWIICVFTGIFTFTISLQSILSKAADTMTKKTIQVAVGKFIPMIGGTLSGSLESLFSMAASTKTYAGIFGIIILISIFVPIVLDNIFFGFCFLILKHVSAFFKTNYISCVLQSMSDTFFMLSALISACAFMLMVSFLIIAIKI